MNKRFSAHACQPYCPRFLAMKGFTCDEISVLCSTSSITKLAMTAEAGESFVAEQAGADPGKNLTDA